MEEHQQLSTKSKCDSELEVNKYLVTVVELPRIISVL